MREHLANLFEKWLAFNILLCPELCSRVSNLKTKSIDQLFLEGLHCYYIHILMVTDAYRVISEWCHNLEWNSIVISYNLRGTIYYVYGTGVTYDNSQLTIIICTSNWCIVLPGSLSCQCHLMCLTWNLKEIFYSQCSHTVTLLLQIVKLPSMYSVRRMFWQWNNTVKIYLNRKRGLNLTIKFGTYNFPFFQ